MGCIDWNQLSSAVQVPLRSLDIGAQLAAFAERNSHRPGPVSPAAIPMESLGEIWNQLGLESLDSSEPRLRWASPSTLVAAASANVESSALDERARTVAQERGAALSAPIYPASGKEAHWQDYRSWFPLASEIDNGSLQVIAFYNPALAVQTAISIAPGDLRFDYRDSERILELALGPHSLRLQAEIASFMGLMRGFLPEQTIAAAILHGAAILRRTADLFQVAETEIGAEAVRFAGTLPVFRTTTRLVADPVGGAFLLDGGLPKNHNGQLRRAADATFSTGCTCNESRRVHPILRHRSDVYSFSSDSSAVKPLHVPIGNAHCLIFELACSHTASRPGEAEWQKAGWTLERCHSAWEDVPLDGELLMVRRSGLLSRAVLIGGSEVAALVASESLRSSLGRLAGFTPGAALTAYAPTSNVVFLTDEAFTDESHLHAGFARGVWGRVLEAEALELGTDVRYFTNFRVHDTAPRIDITTRELVLSAQPRVGVSR